MSKISVIGAGSVGATIANDLMIQGVASEIVLIDINKKKAIGEALITAQLEKIPNEKARKLAKEYVENIHLGKRDFRF